MCWAIQSCSTFSDPKDCSLPDSSVHGIFQVSYWSQLLFPIPGDLPNPGIKLKSPALQADALTSEPSGKQDLLELTPKKDVLFIIGDWTAKVGSQETPGVTGKFVLGVQNEAGQRLIEFCQENTLVIANTLFQQHKRRLYTWTSPDGQHRNQIDYVLCSQRWRSCIQSAKTRPGADCGSDHELLMLNSDWNWRKWGKLLDHSGMT